MIIGGESAKLQVPPPLHFAHGMLLKYNNALTESVWTNPGYRLIENFAAGGRKMAGEVTSIEPTEVRYGPFLALGSDDAIYCVGATFDGNASPEPMRTLKYDADGVFQWEALGAEGSGGISIAVAPHPASTDSVYVTGAVGQFTGDSDFAIWKLDGDGGDDLWQQPATFTGNGNLTDQSHAIGLDNCEFVYATGQLYSTSYEYEMFTVKCDPQDGAEIWQDDYHGTTASADDIARDLTVFPGGTPVATGWSYGGAGTANDYASLRYDPHYLPATEPDEVVESTLAGDMTSLLADDDDYLKVVSGGEGVASFVTTTSICPTGPYGAGKIKVRAKSTMIGTWLLVEAYDYSASDWV